jgi:predicted nucleic acid-binding protein
MRPVLDTSVLIAAFISRGVCQELVERCQQEHRMISSAMLLEGFETKLVAERAGEPRSG